MWLIGNKKNSVKVSMCQSVKVKAFNPDTLIHDTLTPRNGFTLIEIMVAIVVLSIGLVGIGRAYMASIGALGIGRENTEAFCLLKQKMGEIEERAIKEEGLSTETSRGIFEGDYNNYEWTTDIKSASDNLVEVDLSVHREGSRRIFTLETYEDGKE